MIPAHRDAAFRMVLIVPLAIALVPAPVPGQTILPWQAGRRYGHDALGRP